MRRQSGRNIQYSYKKEARDLDLGDGFGTNSIAMGIVPRATADADERWTGHNVHAPFYYMHNNIQCNDANVSSLKQLFEVR